MGWTGRVIVIFEIVGYGVLLNFGYPYDTVTAALVAICIVAGTWALDSLVGYIRGVNRRR
jgi:hypothetical protein